MHELNELTTLYTEREIGSNKLNNSLQEQSNGDDSSKTASPDALLSLLSLADSIADPDIFLKFRALERYGLEEFSVISAEIANRSADSAQRASDYLARKGLRLDCHGMENIPSSGPDLNCL